MEEEEVVVEERKEAEANAGWLEWAGGDIGCCC